VPELFAIETDRLILSWNGPKSSRAISSVFSAAPPPGQLRITALRRGLQFGAATWRADVPAEVARDPLEKVGPRLYEETDYTVYVRSTDSSPVVVETRDPVLTAGLNSADGGHVVHGVVNFGSQAGMSEFVVRVGKEREVMFSVEVFPSKLDYRTDYEQLIADIQDILSALALEYLRSTYQLGTTATGTKTSHLEWLTLLRFVANELERAFALIVQRPHRVLLREPELVRVERVRRPDAALRTAVLRRRGAGLLLNLGSEVSVRENIPSSRPRPSLDTPEHRWLGAQLTTIRRRLAELRIQESQRTRSARRTAAVTKEIDGLLGVITRLVQSEPIANAPGSPPAGFASLQLLRAPGYKEAYRACLILSLGLRIEGGPLRLSLKDISELYEYWCLLALLREISEESGQPMPAKDLLRVEQQGLHVRLQRGREHVSRFTMVDGRKLSVTFNPLYPTATTAQRPDIVVAVDDPVWPTIHLVLDAKYRIETSPEYMTTYGSPGPPEDAINVLHRYRDAILETAGLDANRPKRTIIQAAALFPYQDADGRFGGSRLWKALGSVGVGAMPFLPGETRYVREWLGSTLRTGGWRLADQAVPHRSSLQIATWRSAAAEPVLIGVLHAGAESEHLHWIIEHRFYYLTLFRSDAEYRQCATRHVAIYSPAAIRPPGAVTHVAPVLAVDVVPRKSLGTPWPSSADPAELQIVYHLGEVHALPRPIVNHATDTRAERISQPRWTSKLALDRADYVRELLLDTEQEWRLYEELRAVGARFEIRAGRPRWLADGQERGRAWFSGARLRAQYRGAAGFIIESDSGQEYRAAAADVAARFASAT
jgi:predicted component of viral defense system (DUF524 family)